MLYRKIGLLIKYIECRLKHVNIFWSIKSSVALTSEINNQGKMVLSKRIVLGRYTRLSTVEGGCLEVKENVFFNRNCIIACRKRIVIGQRCSFGPNVCIYDHDHVFDMNGLISTQYRTGEVIIEDGCWFGAGTIILRNTHIGEGCVIGAGTVVQGNIPPHSLVTSSRELLIRPIQSRGMK